MGSNGAGERNTPLPICARVIFPRACSRWKNGRPYLARWPPSRHRAVMQSEFFLALRILAFLAFASTVAVGIWMAKN